MKNPHVKEDKKVPQKEVKKPIAQKKANVIGESSSDDEEPASKPSKKAEPAKKAVVIGESSSDEDAQPQKKPEETKKEEAKSTSSHNKSDDEENDEVDDEVFNKRISDSKKTVSKVHRNTVSGNSLKSQIEKHLAQMMMSQQKNMGAKASKDENDAMPKQKVNIMEDGSSGK